MFSDVILLSFITIIDLRGFQTSYKMESTRKRVRYMFDVNFSATEEKEAFTQRLGHIRKLLTSSGGSSPDNCGLMLAMFDVVERDAREVVT